MKPGPGPPGGAQTDARAEWVASVGQDFLEALRPFAEPHRVGFLADAANEVFNGRGFLSERQTEATRSALANRAEKTEAKIAAGHFGVEGESGQADVTVTYVSDAIDGDFGVRWRVSMETTEGHALSTLGNGNWIRMAEVGQKSRIKFRVKRHALWQDAPQTEVTHVNPVNP